MTYQALAKFTAIIFTTAIHKKKKTLSPMIFLEPKKTYTFLAGKYWENMSKLLIKPFVYLSFWMRLS